MLHHESVQPVSVEDEVVLGGVLIPDKCMHAANLREKRVVLEAQQTPRVSFSNHRILQARHWRTNEPW
jgi:hypothetical protein